MPACYPIRSFCAFIFKHSSKDGAKILSCILLLSWSSLHSYSNRLPFICWIVHEGEILFFLLVTQYRMHIKIKSRKIVFFYNFRDSAFSYLGNRKEIGFVNLCSFRKAGCWCTFLKINFQWVTVKKGKGIWAKGEIKLWK